MTNALASILVLAAAALPQEPRVTAHVQPAGVDAPASGAVRGRVLSERTRQPVESAIVQVMGVANAVTITDSTGAYVIGDVPSGVRVIRARGLDHLPLEVQVTISAQRTTTLEFNLELAPVPLSPITVVQRRLTMRDTMARPAPFKPSQDNVLASAMETLGSSPGVAELGLAEAIRSAHGPEPPDPSDILYVRGATADLKSVYLDGAPVYAPVHLGGLTEAFHPGLLSSGILYTGGASARFDGGLSYVLDLRTRPGRGGPVRTEGALDMSAGRALVEGSVTHRANFLVGGRVVHGLASELWTGDDAPSGYGEVVARMDGALGPSRQLSGTFFWNEETVNLGAHLADDPGPVHWGNLAGAIRLYADIPEGEAQLGFAFGSFSTRLPVAGSELRVIEGRSERHRATADFRHSRPRFGLDYGLSFERMRLEHVALSAGVAENLVHDEATLQGDILGGYLSSHYAVFPTLLLRGGVRANAFMAQTGSEVATRFSPRVDVSWSASDRAVLSLGVGRYHQFVQDRRPLTPDELSFFEALDEEEFQIASRLGVAGATHVVASIEQAFDHGFRFGLEGYYKSFETRLRRPQVQASGIDIWLRRAGPVWESSVGYSTGWVWAVQDTSLSTSIFAGRHLVDASVGAWLGDRNRVKVRTTYATGLPYTAIPHGGDETRPPPSAAAPPPAMFANLEPEEGPGSIGFPHGSYLRVEGEVSRTWRGGPPESPYELTAYLRVLNGLDRRDAMFVRVDEPSGGRASLDEPFPVLPVLGVRWNF